MNLPADPACPPSMLALLKRAVVCNSCHSQNNGHKVTMEKKNDASADGYKSPYKD